MQEGSEGGKGWRAYLEAIFVGGEGRGGLCGSRGWERQQLGREISVSHRVIGQVVY